MWLGMAEVGGVGLAGVGEPVGSCDAAPGEASGPKVQAGPAAAGAQAATPAATSPPPAIAAVRRNLRRLNGDPVTVDGLDAMSLVCIGRVWQPAQACR